MECSLDKVSPFTQHKDHTSCSRYLLVGLKTSDRQKEIFSLLSIPGKYVILKFTWEGNTLGTTSRQKVFSMNSLQDVKLKSRTLGVFEFSGYLLTSSIPHPNITILRSRN